MNYNESIELESDEEFIKRMRANNRDEKFWQRIAAIFLAIFVLMLFVVTPLVIFSDGEKGLIPNPENIIQFISYISKIQILNLFWVGLAGACQVWSGRHYNINGGIK